MAGRATFGQISENDFSNLLQMLSSTPKGRAFLDEYRRRAQPEDTLSLLHSLHRIEATIGAVRDQLQPQRIADELLHIATSLDIAMEGADIDPEGDEAARRFALADRARHELQTLAASLAGGPPELVVTAHGADAADDDMSGEDDLAGEDRDGEEAAHDEPTPDVPPAGALYRLRDPDGEAR